MKPIVKYNGDDLYLEKSEYLNGRLALLLKDKNDELWGDLTINLPDLELEENEIFINSNISSELKDLLYETGVFINLYSTQQYNMGRYDLAYVNMELLNDYLKGYMIEIWETEEDRNQGFGFIYDKFFDNVDEAIEYAKHLYEKNNFASIEVLDEDNHAYFCKDSESEEYYNENDKITKVDAVVLDEYIDNWMDHKELPIQDRKIYCQMIAGGYLAIDNSRDECFVEEFTTEKEAQNWLFNIEKENEVVNEI